MLVSFKNEHFVVAMWALFVLIVAFLIPACGEPKEEDRFGDIAEGIYRNKIVDRGNKLTTASGLRVEGYNKINPALLPEYDAGATNLFGIVRNPPYNYTSNVSPGDYRVYIFPRSSYCQTAGFAIPGGWNAWDQTEFDKDQRPNYTLICAAGIMFGGNTLVVADDVGIARNIVRYELEHWVLYYNDPERFEQNVGVHAHPLFPEAGLTESDKTAAGRLFDSCVLLTK